MRRLEPHKAGRHFSRETIGRKAKIVVSSDGSGVVCQAGGLLLAQMLRVSGLDRGLSAGLEAWRRPGAVRQSSAVGRASGRSNTFREVFLRRSWLSGIGLGAVVGPIWFT